MKSRLLAVYNIFCSIFVIYSQSHKKVKFGYKPDMKVSKNKDPSIFFAIYWNLLSKSDFVVY